MLGCKLLASLAQRGSDLTLNRIELLEVVIEHHFDIIMLVDTSCMTSFLERRQMHGAYSSSIS